MSTLELQAHGRSYRIHDPGGGKIAKAMREGVGYEHPILEDMYADGYAGIAVDAGANIGNHTLWLAAICGLRVEAFEPLKHPELQANVELNGLQDRVQVHPVALGRVGQRAAVVGKGRLDLNPEGAVSVRSLDSYGLQDVAVIKIDVEGMEADVLSGAANTIIKYRPVIYAEAWDETYHRHNAEVLRPLGYHMTRTYRWNQQRWEPR